MKPLPKTLLEAVQYFSDEDTAHAFFVRLRWVDGKPVCPFCAHTEHSFVTTRRVYKCKKCHKQFTAKKGTIFEDSPISLSKWLPAIWMIANMKNGVSSHELGRSLGVTQKTAWFMLHRIRTAMKLIPEGKMTGIVEADETFVGGAAKNMHKDKREEKISGRGTAGKAVVMGLLERKGHVRAKVIPDTGKETLHAEVKANVAERANLYTDGHWGYQGLASSFIHETVDHAVTYANGNVHTNGIENFWALFKRAIKGTYVSVTPRHLTRYVEEEVFRFNNRQTNDYERFKIVLELVKDRRLTYKQLIQITNGEVG